MTESIFQTPEWGEFKQKTGYREQFRLDDILVLEHTLPLGRSMLYSPMISEIRKSKLENKKFLDQIKTIAAQNKSVFYRAEFDIAADDCATNNLTIQQFNNDLRKAGFRKSFEEMQPEHTLILDINKSEDDILAQMKQKGRYNIKIAERSGVVILSTDQPGQELKDFTGLYQTMAERQKISFRDKQYFESLLEILGQKGYVRVYTASIEENGQRKVLAGAIISFYNKRATYLFGGSSNDNRNLMAPYLLHWQIIKDARAAGCTEYDFFGIAPNDDEKHPWAGVTRFKKQFGGREVHLLGSWDLVFRPVEYQVFKWGEKIRRS